MRASVIIVAMSILASATALAGGDSFEAEIVSLTAKSQDEYRLELIQHTAAYAAEPPSQLTFQ